MSERKFAVFDIDGTLARTSLYLQIVHAMLDAGLLPRNKVAQLDKRVREYNNRTHSDAFREYTRFIVDMFEENFKKIRESDYRGIVDEVVTPKKQHSYVYTRNLLKQLKDQEYFLIALSGSEMYSVKQFTSHYDFDLAVGEQYEVQKEFFTGKTKKVVNHKDSFIKRFVDEHNLTYKDSVAIGDSMGDASMLELVERPIAFNPEDRLFDLARSKGWSIVVERKNVIYELEQQNGTYVLA